MDVTLLDVVTFFADGVDIDEDTQNAVK